MSHAQNHPAFAALKSLGAFGSETKAKKPAAAATAAAAPTQPVLDAVQIAALRDEAILDAADASVVSGLRMDVAAAIQQWAETVQGDLDENETMADRLFALIVGTADGDKDGDLTDDESELISVGLEYAYDYLTGKGVAEADALALLQDNDADAGGRVLDFIKGALPEGEEASMDDVDSFAFDDETAADVFDAVLDAVYKKKIVVRGAKKVRINKRVSGRVVLSAGQKVAIRKARRKAHSGMAKMRRAKSMRVRARAGL